MMGFDILCDGQRAFINCTRDLLLKDGITLLPSEQTVVEILESVEPDDLVLAACQRLKVAGYAIALDDYVANDPREPLIALADIVKVDFERTTRADQQALVKRFAPMGRRMLAEKVETQEQFAVAQEMGFVYFQGYFFRRPEVLRAREIPTNRANYLRMLAAVSKDEMDLRELEQIIKVEASVLYRLLRLSELAHFRHAQRDSFHPTRPGPARRAGDPALDPAGDAGFRRPAQNLGPGTFGAGARAFLRAGLDENSPLPTFSWWAWSR